jgi:hypothetical protein
MVKAGEKSRSEGEAKCLLNIPAVTANTLIFTTMGCVILHHNWGILRKRGMESRMKSIVCHRGKDYRYLKIRNLA